MHKLSNRISELAEKAYTPYSEHHIDLEKFANSIIQECVNVCLERRNPGNLNYKPSETFASAIKQHFGV